MNDLSIEIAHDHGDGLERFRVSEQTEKVSQAKLGVLVHRVMSWFHEDEQLAQLLVYAEVIGMLYATPPPDYYSHPAMDKAVGEFVRSAVAFNKALADYEREFDEKYGGGPA